MSGKHAKVIKYNQVLRVSEDYISENSTDEELTDLVERFGPKAVFIQGFISAFNEHTRSCQKYFNCDPITPQESELYDQAVLIAEYALDHTAEYHGFELYGDDVTLVSSPELYEAVIDLFFFFVETQETSFSLEPSIPERIFAITVQAAFIKYRIDFESVASLQKGLCNENDSYDNYFSSYDLRLLISGAKATYDNDPIVEECSGTRSFSSLSQELFSSYPESYFFQKGRQPREIKKGLDKLYALIFVSQKTHYTPTRFTSDDPVIQSRIEKLCRKGSLKKSGSPDLITDIAPALNRLEFKAFFNKQLPLPLLLRMDYGIHSQKGQNEYVPFAELEKLLPKIKADKN
jgi:hypothetical protein